MKLRFPCPACGFPGKILLPGPADWDCPRCANETHLEKIDSQISVCGLCGNPELYKKKDFPHWLGMTILVIACLASVVTYHWYEKWLTWGILIGSALIDGILYLSVGDAIVCYRCHAHYHGIKAGEAHRPFELTIGERYRQERLRLEQMKKEMGKHQ